ncbi:CRISPR-associated protein Cas4 [Candidatus Woesearchaeota archaeon]|nr:CRISPR-associated protein Cas4 [Candidatus Woesearchaeota archaeon]
MRPLSVSMLSSYLYCRRKLFLQYVLKLTEPDKSALVKGSVRHETYEGINEIDKYLVEGIQKGESFEDIQKRLLNAYSGILRKRISKNLKRLRSVEIDPIGLYKNTLPYFEKESMLRTEHLFKFINRYNLYGAELWEKLVPKIHSEIRITSERYGIRGIVDRIEEYPEGFVPVELKTGKAPREGAWPGHRIQLGAYALLMEEYYGKEIKEGFIHYLDNDEKVHIDINPFFREEIKELKEKVRALVNSREIPEIECNKNKCMKCGLREQCFDEKLLKFRLNQLKNK